MKVKDLMIKNVFTTKRNETLIEAIEKLEKYDIGMLPVVDDSRRIEGVITDRDILIRKVLKDKNIDGLVKDAMTTTVVVIEKDEDILKAIEKFKSYQLRRLPVVNCNNELVGVITLSDIAICKQTQEFLAKAYREVALPNPQTEKPLKYLKVDDFPL